MAYSEYVGVARMSLRDNAQCCFEMARQAVNAEARARWLEMAQFWLHKAERQERPQQQAQLKKEIRAPSDSN
jgi:Holliday junction resolvase-like predicted endonuclease